MIKNWFKLIIIMAFINNGCSAQKDLLISNIDGPGKKQPVEDSVLIKLRNENDLVIAFAVESFAWVRSINYHIIAQNNGEWKGYVYHKNLMPNNAGSPTTITTAAVNKEACDALINYITENKAWDIKGDTGDKFCSNGNKNCNINDAPGSRLWLITKTGAVNPYYYAPDFFERCCPDAQRGLFLSITKKIAAIVAVQDETE